MSGYLWLPALIAICCTSGSLHGGEPPDGPELLAGRTIALCKVMERPATRNDIRLTPGPPILQQVAPAAG